MNSRRIIPVVYFLSVTGGNADNDTGIETDLGDYMKQSARSAICLHLAGACIVRTYRQHHASRLS